MVIVNLFAGMAESAGTRRLDLEWTGGSVAELRRRIGDRIPAIAELLARSAVAVGNSYAADADQVPGEADVAIIPPVSGG
jgi:molybdopterin converting factor small subunit